MNGRTQVDDRPCLGDRLQQHPVSLDAECTRLHGGDCSRSHVFSLIIHEHAHMTRRLWYPLSILALTVALLPVNTAAVSADTIDPVKQVDTETAELLRLLNSDSVAEQERAVRRIGMYAHTGQRDASFFNRLVTPLHGLVVNGKTDAVRIMAVSALSSIGTDAAMQGLQTRVDNIESVRVQRIAKNALAAHSAQRIAAKKQ